MDMDNGHLERLTEALYKVTDRMNDSDDLKWRLRKAALEFEGIASRNQEHVSYTDKESGVVLLRTVRRMLKLASSSSYLARVNFETLLREYGAFDQGLLAGADSKPESFVESKQDPVVEQDKKPEVAEEPNQEKPTVTPESPKTKVETPVSRVDSPNVSTRQERVMQYLFTNKSAGVGDLAVLFSGEVSEKTLQRDLAQLMIQGRVRAEGEKRWRRYYILEN
ncbi:MAG: hypothetical protein O2794_04100 [bacterium]|nr:hypothetical protein [bacterium]